MENRILRSEPGSPIAQGDSTAIISPVGQGANNQTTPDETVPVNGGMPIFFYGDSDITAAVAFEHPTEGYRTVFCGFGIEAVPSDPLGYLSRAELLQRILEWFNVLETPENAEVTAPVPSGFSLSVWPNPFNPTFNFTVELAQTGTIHATLFNQLGRTVTSWNTTRLHPGRYGFSWDGTRAAAGVYFLNVRTGDGNSIRRVVLLK